MKKITDFDISKVLTMGVGGIVSNLFIPKDREELKEIIISISKDDKQSIIVGGGSNIIFRDGFIDANVIINDFYDEIIISNNQIFCGSSVFLKDLLKFCVENNISGFEFLAGIPGTVGGALYGNAGAYGHSISELVEKIEVYDRKQNKIKFLKKDSILFDYRDSILKKNKYFIISAVFNISELKESIDIEKNIKSILNIRNQKLPPWGTKCSGSFFKNVLEKGKNRRTAAAYFIEKSGCKGMMIGDIIISEKHANFITNVGNGTFSDIILLSEEVKRKVYEGFGITLHEEVCFFPPNI